MADEVFLVKQQTNLVKTWLAEGVEGVEGGGRQYNCRSPLIDTKVHGYKVSKAYSIV